MDRGAAHLAKAKAEAARVLYHHEGSEWADDTDRHNELAAVVVPAVEPHVWRAVAAWVRETCEFEQLCDTCAAQAELIDIRADELQTELEASNPDGPDRFGEVRKHYRAAEREWRAALVAPVLDMLAATAPGPIDGVMDLPAPPPTRAPAGTDIYGFAAAYAAVSAGWDDDASYTYPLERTAWRRGADGGLWLVDASPSDEEVMRPIVEEAMRGIGMNVPIRPIIPALRAQARALKVAEPIGNAVTLNQWEYAAFSRAAAAGNTSEAFRREWEGGMYARGVIENGRARITCRSPHMMEEDTRDE